MMPSFLPGRQSSFFRTRNALLLARGAAIFLLFLDTALLSGDSLRVLVFAGSILLGVYDATIFILSNDISNSARSAQCHLHGCTSIPKNGNGRLAAYSRGIDKRVDQPPGCQLRLLSPSLRNPGTQYTTLL